MTTVEGILGDESDPVPRYLVGKLPNPPPKNTKVNFQVRGLSSIETDEFEETAQGMNSFSIE